MASFHVAATVSEILGLPSSVSESTMLGDLLEMFLEAAIVLAVFATCGKYLKKQAKPKKLKVASYEPPAARQQPEWRAAAQASQKATPAQPSLASFNDAMKKAAMRGDVEACSQICKDIRAAGLKPSEVTIEILLDACLKAKDFDRACAILLDISKGEASLSVGHCAACVRGLVSDDRSADAESFVRGLVANSQNNAFKSALASAVSPLFRKEAPAAPARQQNSASVLPRLEQFIKLNNLDPRCAQTLRKADPVQAEWIMDQEFKVEVDPTKGSASAKVVGTYARAQRKPEEFWASYPTAPDLQKRMQTFVELNNLDRRCVQTLEQLSEERLAWVMGREFIVQVDPTRGSASGKVIGRVVHSSRTA